MWKIDPKDKHIHKNKHDHTQTQKYNMTVIAELLYGTQERIKLSIEPQWYHKSKDVR
jgi:hypothetical protein